MDKIKKHFEEEAHEFDQIVLKLIPCYEEMISALFAAIPFELCAEQGGRPRMR